MSAQRFPAPDWLRKLFLQGTLGIYFLLQSVGGFGGLSLLLPVLLIGMVLMTAIPNQRKQKKWNEMLAGLKSGDRVTTTGGLRGTVLQVKDEVIVLRVLPDNLKLEFVKSAISAVTTEEPKS